MFISYLLPYDLTRNVEKKTKIRPRIMFFSENKIKISDDEEINSSNTYKIREKKIEKKCTNSKPS